MASAILLGAVQRGMLDPAGVAVVDPASSRQDVFEAAGIRVLTSAAMIDEELDERTQVMLAVKPQMLAGAAEPVRGWCDRLGGLVVWSILAGVRCERVRERCGSRSRVIRLMPNTPARVGKGCTAMVLGDGVSEADAALAKGVFGSVGFVIDLEEGLMDAFTALAGSGPAYVFAMVEALAAAGERVGMEPRVAMLAARQTVIGAAGLLEVSEDSAAALREAVTSKGGTTAAGLGGLAEGGFAEAVQSAVRAARDRGAELGREADGGASGG